MKEAVSVKDEEKDSSKVVKVLKVGEVVELVPGGTDIAVTL